MNRFFKANLTADFLRMMEDSFIGKGITRKTGLSAFKMLTHFTLITPAFSNSSAWLVDYIPAINIDPLQIDYVILFLKYAWLYSEKEKNTHNDNLIHFVCQEVTQFEKDLLIEDSHKRLIESHETLTNQECLISQKDIDLKITKEVLLKSQESLQIQKIQISKKNKDLKVANKELTARRLKEKKISLKNSESASEIRSCIEVNEWLKKLVKDNQNRKTCELWSSLSDGRNGGDFYKENKKIHHQDCQCMPFGIKAFYRRVKDEKDCLKNGNSS